MFILLYIHMYYRTNLHKCGSHSVTLITLYRSIYMKVSVLYILYMHIYVSETLI